MTRYPIRLAFPSGVADVIALATDEGADGIRCWGALGADGRRIRLTPMQRAQAEAAVAALASQQADLFAKGA